jgi:hypothetical protein
MTENDMGGLTLAVADMGAAQSKGAEKNDLAREGIKR